MEIFFYFFVKILFDLLGFYLIIFFGNKYIVFLIDIYLGWLEVFCVVDKLVDNIVYIILDEIFFCNGCFL